MPGNPKNSAKKQALFNAKRCTSLASYYGRKLKRKEHFNSVMFKQQMMKYSKTLHPKQIDRSMKFYLSLFVIVGACIGIASAEQCNMNKTIVSSYHPYCNNDTRAFDYSEFADNNSTFTCSNSIYINVRFPTTHYAIIDTDIGTGDVLANTSRFTCYDDAGFLISSPSCNVKCEVEKLYETPHVINSTYSLCDGDLYYCKWVGSSYSCPVSKKYPECFCRGFFIGSSARMSLAKGNTYCLTNGTQKAFISSNDIHNQISVVNPVREFTETFMEFDGKTLYVKTKSDCNCYLEVKKEDWFQAVRFSGSEAMMIIPDVALIKSGLLYVTVKDDDGMEEDKEFSVVGHTVCRLHDCVLCKESFTHFKCLPTALKGGIYFFFSILILLVLVACPMVFNALFGATKWSFKLTLFLIKIPKRILHSNFISGIKNRCMSIKKEVLADEEIALNSNKNLDTITTTKESSNIESVKILENDNDKKLVPHMCGPNCKNHMHRKTLPPHKKVNLCILLVALLLPIVGADVGQWGCSEVLTITGVPSTSCIGKYPDRANCSLAFESDITFTKPMQKLCRLIQDDKNNNIGYLEVSLIQVEQVFDLNSIYYTSDYKVTSQSAHRCYSAGSCSNTTCAALQSRNAGGELMLNDLNFFPGRTLCTRRAGCAANGCLLCVDGCVYTGYALIPEGPAYQIYDPLQMTFQPQILINYTSGSGSNNVVKKLSIDALWYDATDFSIQLLSEFLDTSIDLDNYKVMTDGRNHFLTRANEVNTFTPRLIGDIQSPTAADLELPTVNFAFDPKNFVLLPQGKYDSIEILPTGLSQLNKDDQLPRFYDGYLWSFDTSGKLKSNKTDGISVSFTLTSSQTLKFTDFTSTVCPRASAALASGCFDCNIGSNVNLTIKSICDNGLISLTTDVDYITVKTQYLQISKSNLTYLMEFETTQAENNFNLILIGTNSNFSVNIIFTAVSISDVITNQTYVVDNNPEEPSHKGSWGSLAKFFDEAFLGRGHWIAYLIIGAIVTIIITAIVFLIKHNKKNYSYLVPNIHNFVGSKKQQ